MNYTLMTAQGDYASLDLDKSGTKYIAYVYVYGFGITHKEEFEDYKTAEKRYLEMCKTSNVTPVVVEHDLADMMANV